MREQLATQFVAAPPGELFALITTPDRLPAWNRAIVGVVDAPDELSPGAEWVVQLSALGQSWPSRSTVVAIDRQARHFAYRSQTDDGNPSYTDWSWKVVDAPGGCEVTVSCALHPATFWRRVLLSRIRSWQLRRRELPSSLHALASSATSVHGP
ncbi:MAG TPA: SRPBCC family protein [Acidimicrobiia bacterium]|nr:SRPBCC family protein [Acidimicrobiia bacterium]